MTAAAPDRTVSTDSPSDSDFSQSEDYDEVLNM